MIKSVDEKATKAEAAATEAKNGDASKPKAEAPAGTDTSSEKKETPTPQAKDKAAAGVEAKPAESASAEQAGDAKAADSATAEKTDTKPEPAAEADQAKTEDKPAAEAAATTADAAHSAPTVAATRSQMKQLLDEAREAKSEEAEDSGEGKRTRVEPAEAHVLVVEDNVPNFVLIARLLAYMGVQRCEWKTSGWQVVEFADTLPRIDLVLMDIQLPYEDGFQALQKLRGHPRLKDTLVVAVTANASVDQMNKAKVSGFDGFLAKPLNPDKFPEQIKRILTGEEVWEL